MYFSHTHWQFSSVQFSSKFHQQFIRCILTDKTFILNSSYVFFTFTMIQYSHVIATHAQVVFDPQIPSLNTIYNQWTTHTKTTFILHSSDVFFTQALSPWYNFFTILTRSQAVSNPLSPTLNTIYDLTRTKPSSSILPKYFSHTHVHSPWYNFLTS